MSSQPKNRMPKKTFMDALPKIAVFLRELFCNAGFYTGFVLLTLLTIIVSPPVYLVLRLIGTHDSGQAVRRIIWFYGKGWVWLIARFVPFRMTMGDPQDYPQSCIVVANHLSFFDAFCLGTLPMYNLVFAVRSWPFKIPFYGPYMHRAKYLNTERMSYEDFLNQAKKRLNQQMTMIIFPEGTRSTNGELGRFHSGAFKLAIETGTPIVPVSISGTGAFLPKGKLWVKPHPITVTILPPADPKLFAHLGPLAHRTMSKYVRDLIAQHIIPSTTCNTDCVHLSENPIPQGE